MPRQASCTYELAPEMVLDVEVNIWPGRQGTRTPGARFAEPDEPTTYEIDSVTFNGKVVDLEHLAVTQCGKTIPLYEAIEEHIVDLAASGDL